MSKKGYLTAEEYVAIRKTLGFTQEQLVQFHGVQSVRTIKRWEKGDSFISEMACDKIMNLFTQINAVVETAIEKWEANPVPTTLIIYPDECYKKFVVGIGDLPNSIHRAMIERVYCELVSRGADVDLVKFNPQIYMIWLANKGLKDGQDVRGMWAAEYSEKLKRAN
jgi:transcriptional regulator with XRE-family HTH domain